MEPYEAVSLSMKLKNLNCDVLSNVPSMGQALKQKISEALAIKLGLRPKDVTVMFAEGAQGSVVLQVLVNPSGKVSTEDVEEGLSAESQAGQDLPVVMAQAVSQVAGIQAATLGKVRTQLFQHDSGHLQAL